MRLYPSLVPVVSLVAAWIALAAPPLRAQQPAAVTPAFEVASIKRNTSEGPNNYWQISGPRFIGNKSQIAQLIRMAWGNFQLRLERFPEWIFTEPYDVIAIAPTDVVAGSPSLGQMMRTLLIERFSLAAHTEPRDEPIYALVRARPDGSLGPRLQPPLADCPLARGSTMQPGVCGPGVEPGRMKWGNSGIDGLVLNLARQTGRRVVDETGLAGGFRIDLEFTPQPLSATPPAPGQNEPALPGGLTIFEALQQQLGLKLESRRGTVEVLVIDRIERPTPD